MVWQCLGSCDGRNWRRREKPYPPSNRHESLSRQADKGNTWLLGLCLTGLRSSLLLKEFIYINNSACLLPSVRSGGIFISCESVAVMLWPLVEQLLRRLNPTNQPTNNSLSSLRLLSPAWMIPGTSAWVWVRCSHCYWTALFNRQNNHWGTDLIRSRSLIA